MAKTKILPIVATAILAGAMFFAGCEKEKTEQNISEKTANAILSQWGIADSVCQALLDASYTVAEEVDGEFQLTFDAEQFLSLLENNLNTYSDTQYVTESVSVFYSDDFNAPILSISIYDVTHEKSDKAFYFLSVGAINNGLGTGWMLPDGQKTTVKCTTSGVCCINCQQNTTQCCWPTSNGCTPCCKGAGSCQQEVTGEFAVLMVCKTLSEL